MVLVATPAPPYAEVAVDLGAGGEPGRRTFTYRVPPGIPVRAGSLVQVPFGARLLQGVVTGLAPDSSVPGIRDIAGVLGDRPWVRPWQLPVASWLAQYYLSSLFEALALFLPPGIRQVPRWRLRPLPGVPGERLSPSQRSLLDRVATAGALDGEAMTSDERSVAERLVRRGVAWREWYLEEDVLRPRMERWVRLVDDAETVAAGLPASATVMARALGVLQAAGMPVRWGELVHGWGLAEASLRALEARGAVAVEERETGEGHGPWPAARPGPLLTAAQEAALGVIAAQARPDGHASKPVLLDGVTGSGKTEVYLRAAEATLDSGRGVAMLVPEIALVAQTVARFRERFGDRVAVLHSGLTPRAGFDAWWRVAAGRADVVIGPRSALFAPFPEPPGLVVLDEAHDSSWKQSDGPVRYDARAVAIQLGVSCGTVVVEGTATPTVEAWYRAKRGVYALAELPARVAGRQEAPIEVVDLRAELVAGNRSMFSRPLQDALREALAAGHQALLFLNRRGSASYVQCRGCGWVVTCPSCDLALTWHAGRRSLVCHQCNRQRGMPRRCGECGSAAIRQLGAGTERVVDEVVRLLPGARVLRWDADTASAARDHATILERLASREVDVVVGTQMMAKGLDVPGVALVGIVNADLGVHLPDFRAAERAWQVLVQVAGRAGRGEVPGRVILQTYQPDHPVIRAAAERDFRALFEHEIAFRRLHGLPPFQRLARLVVALPDADAVLREGARVRQALEDLAAAGAPMTVLGPTPCYFGRLRGRYRSQLLVLGRDLPRWLGRLPVMKGVSIDIDPIVLL